MQTLGWPRAVGLGAGYLGAFALSYPLAKQIGAWPSVGVVTAAAVGATLMVEARAARSADVEFSPAENEG